MCLQHRSWPENHQKQEEALDWFILIALRKNQYMSAAPQLVVLSYGSSDKLISCRDSEQIYKELKGKLAGMNIY